MSQEYTHRFTEEFEFLGADAGTYTPGVYTTLLYRSLANHQRAVAIIYVGDMGAGATVDLQLWQAQDTTGLNAKVITGKAITQLTQAGGDADSACVIEVRTEEMDVDGGFHCLGGVLTVAVANADVGLIGFGGCSNYMPVPTTAWAEIVD